VVRCDSGTELPNEEHFDFLLFDRHTALIHDYGKGSAGRQRVVGLSEVMKE